MRYILNKLKHQFLHVFQALWVGSAYIFSFVLRIRLVQNSMQQLLEQSPHEIQTIPALNSE